MRFFSRISTTSTAEHAATAISNKSEGLIPMPSSGVERTTECLVESIPINCFPLIHLTVAVPILLLCVLYLFY